LSALQSRSGALRGTVDLLDGFRNVLLQPTRRSIAGASAPTVSCGDS
jgi:hypothetical protein